MTATQRCQAALDAQNAINQLWDGSDEKRKQWEDATRLIDLLYETGKNDDDDKTWWEQQKQESINMLIDSVRSEADPDDPTILCERPIDLKELEESARKLGLLVCYWENYGDEIAVSNGYPHTANIVQVDEGEDGPVLSLTWL